MNRPAVRGAQQEQSEQQEQQQRISVLLRYAFYVTAGNSLCFTERRPVPAGTIPRREKTIAVRSRPLLLRQNGQIVKTPAWPGSVLRQAGQGVIVSNERAIVKQIDWKLLFVYTAVPFPIPRSSAKIRLIIIQEKRIQEKENPYETIIARRRQYSRLNDPGRQ